jgi:hypothetical protein
MHLLQKHSGVPACVLSGRAKHDQTTHRQLHRTHIQIEGIRPQTQKRQMTKQAADRWWMHQERRTTPEDGHGIVTEICRVL